LTVARVHADLTIAGKPRSLQILMVTGAYPTSEIPHWGTFIKSQVESLRAEGVTVTVIHPPAGPMPLRYARALLQVILRSASGRYDLIHGHYGLWALLARLQWRIPVVVSFLGDDLLGTPGPDGTPTAKSCFVIRLSTWLSRHADAVIVKSDEMAQRLPAGVNPAVIPNGVDFQLFRPIPRAEARAALGWDPAKFYVVFGNDPGIPRKGFPLARDAVARLTARGLSVELIVANRLPQDQLVLYLNASNALLLSSVWEGSPNIVKEAMACNVPVVAADVGDVRQVIGATAGCTVCARDAEELAAGLQAAIEHPGPTTGRRDIQHLELSLVARRILAVYQRVLAHRAEARVVS
jgi:teichuronic acid biosynthesis glycosyltransferase TuaC